MSSDDIAVVLQTLRRKPIWEGVKVGDYFHATEYKQAVRDAVFKCILEHNFQVQATICEKCKARPKYDKINRDFINTHGTTILNMQSEKYSRRR